MRVFAYIEFGSERKPFIKQCMDDLPLEGSFVEFQHEIWRRWFRLLGYHVKVIFIFVI